MGRRPRYAVKFAWQRIKTGRKVGMEATLESTPISAICPHDPRYLQQLSVQKRKQNQIASELHEKEQEILRMAKFVALQPVTSNPLHAKVVEQIEQIDEAMTDCKPRELASFAQAKATLWKLLFPQPKATRSRQSYTPVEAPPISETPQG